jgi:rubrerythrin
MASIKSSAELYAHAIAIEREATARYLEFAERMSDLGNEAVAQIFSTLATLEGEHLAKLLERTAGMPLPALGDEYSWLGGGAPETVDRNLVFRLMSPHQALQVALLAENRAAVFFETVILTSSDGMLRALACELAADEGDHIAMLEKLLETTPSPVIDWASIYESGAPASRGAG